MTARLTDLDHFLLEHPSQFTSFEDVIVRKLIEKITVVNAEIIRIHFRDQGAEYEQSLC